MHFFHLDASALAKRYTWEQGTPLVHPLFGRAWPDRLHALNLTFAEVVSILVRKRNRGRLSPALYSHGLTELTTEIIAAPAVRKVDATYGLVTTALPLI